MHIPYSTKRSRAKIFMVFTVFAWTVNVFPQIQSVLALMDVVLMQMQMFFCKYSHGDRITKVCSLNILY